MAWRRLRWCVRMSQSKTGRMIIMLILTAGIAITEIVYGIRTRSQLLIADGLFSFAEGVALVGSLVALRYAKAERLDAKNTFGWARLELLAGLLQEVLLLSLSFSIIVDSINKLINPIHIEDPSAMIYLGTVGFCIGLLGLFLFRGYHHDHNIGDEIVEQKKNDFLDSVYDTLRTLHVNHANPELSLVEQKNISIKTTLAISETSLNINEQRTKRHKSILPSLNDTYTNAFLVADKTQPESINYNEQYLRAQDNTSDELNRLTAKSAESAVPSTLVLEEDKIVLENDFEESRVYATLHALCLHSLAVVLESSIVLISGLLNKFVPNRDPITNQPINVWLKYIDPSLTLLMVIIIAIKAIPVIWSLGHILVEAVPSGINTGQLIQTIMKAIPQICAVHSVHVWRATARDVFATFHVVCDEDLPLSTCRDLFSRRLQKIFETHCIRHFTIQFEYVKPGENVNKCAYGTRRRRHRGHQSSSEDDTSVVVQSQADLRMDSLKTNHNGHNSIVIALHNQ
ncbi:unnamed protein product [Rotaria socialis]|uniref:Uncharacterized protein n=1 Tax=Rotaria socialis TaxID=392032 RepID=A0A820HNK7_9BILA|nr:unnamed protein product [Rotaria socialis]CAF3492720.1 unnamed protein product [Rotaria socialis]CAF3701678.1 unnamed protein product [Rotaria socialis]CAF3705914.1 unnamed protein product [Rotaria socialis]CAF4137964.1 unnamed protein product [Rotaria socialis]